MAKKCQRCGYDNADTMRFCLNCGTALSDAPADAVHKTDAPTESFGGVSTNFAAGRETETFSRPNLPPGYPNLSQPKPKSKLGLIIGGAAALSLLLLTAGGAIVFYNWKSKPIYVANVNASPNVSPTANNDKSPTPRNSGTPNSSPTPAVSASPQASFTPPVYATKTGVFTVYANEGWQTSEIDVIRLEQFNVTAVGLIDVGGVKTRVTPKGINDKTSVARRIYPEYPTGALLFRTHYADGHLGNVLPIVSGSYQNFPDELGRLEFCVNDNAPENNGGQFTVVVKMASIPKASK